jgi:peptidoglycan/LPS O-acetylase OafA/YrhL
MRYSPPLDGIRAVAIVAVLLFHIAPAALSGGFTGVDVFFVLSGFLITSIILHDLHEGCFSFREFYLRRIQRLLPNMVVMVLAVLLLWTLFMPPSAARQAAHHSIWTVFNLSNFYILKDLGGYWGDAAGSSPLTHTWSLGIEEQFYLLFPVSLVLLVKFQRKGMRWWLVAATVLSFGLCLYNTRTHPTATFYLLPTRIWELLMGAVLVAHRTPLRSEVAQPRSALRESVQEGIGLAGLGMILLGFLYINDGGAFPGMVALTPTVGAGLVLFSVIDEKTRLSRLLSKSVMVKTGKLSYSVYLWHWPLITLGKALASLYAIPEIYGAAAGGGGGILLGWMVYVGIEQPLRRRGPGRSRRFAALAVGFAITAIYAVSVMASKPVADPEHRFDTLAFFGEQYTAGNAESASKLIQSARYYDVHFPRIPPDRPNDLWRTGGVVRLYGGGPPQVVVIGSSHALMYSRVIDELCRERGLSVAFLGVDATSVFFEAGVKMNFTSPREARDFYEARKQWLRKWRPKVVFVIDRWDGRFGAPQGFAKELHSLLMDISPLAGRVIFVSQVPVVRDAGQSNLREVVTWHVKHENSLPLFYPDRNEPLREQAVAIAEADTASFPNFRVLRADLPFYEGDGSIRYESGRAFFYADGDHLSEMGAEVVRGLFKNAITEAIPLSRN